jgi:hypothetical protein
MSSNEKFLVGRAAGRPGRTVGASTAASSTRSGRQAPWPHDLGVPIVAGLPAIGCGRLAAYPATGCPAGPSEVAADTALPVLPSYVRALALAGRLALGCECSQLYTGRRDAAIVWFPLASAGNEGLVRARCGAASGAWAGASQPALAHARHTDRGGSARQERLDSARASTSSSSRHPRPGAGS